MFKAIGDCRRSVEEQRYIWAALQVFGRLPPPRREKIRALIGRVARTPTEGRALYDVTVRGLTPQSVSRRTGLPLLRLYELRRAFYDQFEI